MLDTNSQPLDGFSLQDCIAVEADGIRQAVSWKSVDISSLAGKQVRLRIRLQNADLYSFHTRKDQK